MARVFQASGAVLLVAVIALIMVGLAKMSRLGYSQAPLHGFAGQCDLCHQGSPTPENARLAADADSICQGCHALIEENSHPFQVVPSMELPQGFPLDEAGRLGCISCHQPHLESTTANPALLRGAVSGLAFCSLCHGAAGDHQGAVFLVHHKSWTPEASAEAGLDRVSRECLACHDGLAGPEAKYCVRGEEGLCSSHPIGGLYDEIQAERRGLSFRLGISSVISFYEERVGCGSCHSIYAQRPQFLVMSNRGSALCLECHEK